MKRKFYKNVDETIYFTTLKNKMKVYLLYKPGFVEKNAYIVTKFGHFDSVRKINIDNKMVKVPYGAAHFLEHRMFSINDIDATDLFANLGATCNAYTTYEKTAYYFSCQKNFYECLDILLKMMSNFSSTESQIENEKSIILQEANMYKEDPNHIINKTIYEQAYINHPINVDIIGTEETIKNTDHKTLKAIFDTFYDPSNLTLICCGDINHVELENYLNEHLIESKNPCKIKPLKIKEPNEVKKEYSEMTMSTVTIPRLALMYKLPSISDKFEKDRMYFCYYFILDYLFSSSGKLSEKWLKSNIISTLVEYSVSSNIDLDCIIFYNITDDVLKVVNAIKDVFKKGNTLNITQEEFDDLKKAHYGYTLRAYESVNGLCSYFVYDLFTSANDYFKEVDEVKQLTLQDMNKAFENICNAITTYVVLRGE